MATTTRVKQWGFSDASIYTLGDDAAIASSALSMTAPALPLPFDAGGWSPEPSYDANGDATPNGSVVYVAQLGGEALSVADGMLAYHITHLVNKVPSVYTRARCTDSLSGGVHARVRESEIFYTGLSILLREDTDGGEVELGLGAFLSTLAPIDVFSARRFMFVADRLKLSLQIGSAENSCSCSSASLLTAGEVQLSHTGSNGAVTIGNGGAAAAPVFYYRRTGTCELKAASAYTIPLGTTALGRLVAVCDRLGDGTEPLDVTLQFKIDDGDWTDVPADGDLSGETFTAGTSTLLWRINDMDNANDCRYVPTVYAVVLTYEQTSPDWDEDGELTAILTNIKAALNADETLMGYEGWSGAYVSWLDAMQPELYHRCGCLIEWRETPEAHRGASKVGGQLVLGQDETHTIVVRACMRPMRDLEDMLIGDDQLLPFTEDVLRVLRAETLGGTVHSVAVKQRTPSLEVFESGGGEDEPEDALLMVDIEVEVHSKPFTATRP